MRGPASRKFKSPAQAQKFLGVHAAVQDLFTLRVQAIWVATWLGLSTIGISGSVRFLNGVGRLLETSG
jgi:hypothetical protein